MSSTGPGSNAPTWIFGNPLQPPVKLQSIHTSTEIKCDGALGAWPLQVDTIVIFALCLTKSHRAVTHVTRTFCFILQKMCSVHPNFSPFATAHTRITASAVMARKRRSEHPTHNSLPISRKGFKNPHMRGCFGGHPCIDFRNLRPGVSDEN